MKCLKNIERGAGHVDRGLNCVHDCSSTQLAWVLLSDLTLCERVSRSHTFPIPLAFSELQLLLFYYHSDLTATHWGFPGCGSNRSRPLQRRSRNPPLGIRIWPCLCWWVVGRVSSHSCYPWRPERECIRALCVSVTLIQVHTVMSVYIFSQEVTSTKYLQILYPSPHSYFYLAPLHSHRNSWVLLQM